ncbi:MobF family relaxase [Aliarcobacter cryaerophilus]|uniref:MobF family relaxase n=1 Tax=Aliarcobacter cryaerophilus TaxID=28198 RepID=UPI0021B1CB33|nr:MobF family relaxase [Aliarcobacter cryaerophilus]MCT7510960.1 relaxase domain-containing protein [Aliarcobacter cryaerophilus]
MSVAGLSGGSAEKYYYEKDPIFNKNGEGENLNWGGNIASTMGLNDGTPVYQKDFVSALNGSVGDTPLRDQSKNTSGDERKAYDLPLSAPKSVSHAGLVLDKKDVVDAHNEAVKKTMDYVQSLAQARVYNENGERVKQDTNKLLYASATHSTSRATEGNVPDPSLHTHNVIMNTTQDKDGKFVSLCADNIFKNQSTINQVYKNELANQLKERGYALDFDKKGNFEISGYDKETLDNFSKRKNEIDKQVEQMKTDPKFAGKTDKELRDFAQHNFKQEKTDISKDDLVKDWDRQHKENGITSKEDLDRKIGEAQAEKKELDKDSTKLTVDQVLKISAENLTDKESHFSREALLSQALKISKGDHTVADFEKAINDIKKTGQKENADLKKITVDGEVRYTTKEIYDIEKENMKLIQQASQLPALLTEEQAVAGIKDFEKQMGWAMTKTQRESAMTLLTTTEQFPVIQGDAGTGKTTMLNAVRHAVEYNGKSSEGLAVLAPTGKAASGAMLESGIKGKTIDSYLMNKTMKEPVTKKELAKAKEELSKGKDLTAKNSNSNNNSVNKSDKSKKDIKTSEKEKIDSFNNSMKENKHKEGFISKKFAVSFSQEYTKIKMGGGKLEITKLSDGSNRVDRSHFNRSTGFMNTYSQTKYGSREMKMGTKNGSDIMKIKDQLKDGSRREIEITKSNLFGRTKSETINSISKKTSDLIFKQDESKFRNISKDGKFSEKKEKETKILSAVSNKIEQQRNFTGTHHVSTSQKSFKGLGIEFNSVTSEKRGNIPIINAQGRVLEFQRDTSLKIFGKDINTNMLNKSYSQREFTFENAVEAVKEFVNKVDNAIRGEKDRSSYQITSSVFNANNELKEQTVITSSNIDNKLREVNVSKTDEKGTTFSKQVQDKDRSVEVSKGSISEKMQNSKKELEMAVVDESSMLSSKKINELMKDAIEKGYRVPFIGDEKQLQSVQQGKGFQEMQREANVVKHMNEGMRQKTAETKEVVTAFAEKRGREGLEILDKQGHLKEMKSSEITSYVADKLATDNSFKNTIALATTRDQVNEINNKVREKLFGSSNAGVSTKVRVDKGLDLVDKMSAINFDKGDMVSMKIKTESGKERFVNYEVKDVNTKTNELLLGSDKKNIIVDLKKDFANISSVEKVIDKNFMEGDKVMNFKNDKEKGVMNGDVGYIKNINQETGVLTVQYGKGADAKSVEYNLNDNNKSLDHSYAMSVHKSQGITEDRCLAVFDTDKGHMNNANMQYVGLSRPKEYMEVITDNKEKLKSQVEKSQVKMSTNDSYESKKERGLDPDAEKSKEVKNVSQIKEENIVNNKNEVLEKFNSKLEEKNVDPKNITNATAKEGEDRTVKFKINDNETKAQATVTLGDNNKTKDVDIRREASSNSALRMPDIKEKINDIANERNHAKSSGDNEKFNQKQREFMNLQVISRGGYSEKDVINYAEKAVDKGHLSRDVADQFINNSNRNASSLVEAGILKVDNNAQGNISMSFADPKAKEILIENYAKTSEQIGAINKEDMNKTIEKIVDKMADKTIEKEDSKVENKVETKEDSKVENKVEAKAETKEDSKDQNKVETKEDSKVENKAETKEDSKVENKVEAKAETKEDSKDQNKVEAKAEGKEESKDQNKVETKEDSKVEAKAETKEDSKDQNKVEAKAEGKEESKDQNKVEAKAEGKEESKDQNKVEAKAEGKDDSKEKVEAKAESKEDSKEKVEAKAETKEDSKEKVEAQAEGKEDQKAETLGKEDFKEVDIKENKPEDLTQDSKPESEIVKEEAKAEATKVEEKETQVEEAKGTDAVEQNKEANNEALQKEENHAEARGIDAIKIDNNINLDNFKKEDAEARGIDTIKLDDEVSKKDMSQSSSSSKTAENNESQKQKNQDQGITI